MNKKELAIFVLEHLKAHQYVQQVVNVLAYEGVTVTKEDIITAIDFAIESIN